MSIYVDTSAWYAVTDYDDAHHRRAVDLLSKFSGGLVTSDHVLVETWFLVSSRHSFDTAEHLIGRIRRGLARVEPTVMADLEVAAEIGRTFADQGFPIVDRTSWAIMERLGIHRAIAFNIEFSIYRFGPQRDKAFEIYT